MGARGDARQSPGSENKPVGLGWDVWMLVVGIACPPLHKQSLRLIRNKCGPGRLGQPLGLGMDGERSVSHERVSRELDSVSHAGCSTLTRLRKRRAGQRAIGV